MKGIGGDLLQKAGVRTYGEYVFNGEVVGYPFSLSDLVNKLGKEFVPSKLGIYHLFYEGGLVYIGMSKNLRGRLLQHLKSQDMIFDSCLWFCAELMPENSLEYVLKMEKKMIKLFKPSLNTMYIECRA